MGQGLYHGFGGESQQGDRPSETVSFYSNILIRGHQRHAGIRWADTGPLPQSPGLDIAWTMLAGALRNTKNAATADQTIIPSPTL